MRKWGSLPAQPTFSFFISLFLISLFLKPYRKILLHLKLFPEKNQPDKK